MQQFLMKVILPAGVLCTAKVHMVTLPGEEGMFGVLAGHAKLVSSLSIGIVSAMSKQKEYKFFIDHGLAQVNQQEVNILTEFAVEIFPDTKNKVTNELEQLRKTILGVGAGDNSFEYKAMNNKLKQLEALSQLI